MAHFHLKLNSYFEDRKASCQEAPSCRLRGNQLRPKKVGQSRPQSGGRGRRSCSSHWRKTQLEIPTSLSPGCIRSGAENSLIYFRGILKPALPLGGQDTEPKHKREVHLLDSMSCFQARSRFGSSCMRSPAADRALRCRGRGTSFRVHIGT